MSTAGENSYICAMKVATEEMTKFKSWGREKGYSKDVQVGEAKWYRCEMSGRNFHFSNFDF